jgi:transcriptional regulator with XRE-family HTH domain
MKYKEVGGKIKEYRHKQEMTQQDLADRVGVTWEMISRYERGLSSPFSRIESISEALNIPSYQLLQNSNNASEYKYFEVPLFTSIPTNNEFKPSNTKLYYSAPRWIYELDTYVYAIESRLLKVGTLDIRDGSGVIFVTSSIISNKGIFIENINNSLTITDSIKNAIGQVVAQEVRFV